MNSLRIGIEINGEIVSFIYEHHKLDRDTWSASIIDECSTVGEILYGPTLEECLNAIVPFITQFGKVVSITPLGNGNPYLSKFRRLLANGTLLS